MTEACRFLTAPGSSDVPLVKTDPADPLLPCAEVTGDTRPKTLVAHPVNAEGCQAQREAGLCPRDLGGEVDLTLTIFPLAKPRSATVAQS